MSNFLRLKMCGTVFGVINLSTGCNNPLAKRTGGAVCLQIAHRLFIRNTTVTGMEVESVLVTGANKGIGLEFVKQFVHLPKPPRYVFATYRNKNAIQELESIEKGAKSSNVVLIQADLTKADDIKSMKKVVEEAVGDRGLTLLVNNAGVMNSEAFPNVTEESMLLHFKVNTVAPLMVFQEVLPLLRKAASLQEGPRKSVSRAAVLNMASIVGSIENIFKLPPDWLIVVGYGTSKAALNMEMRIAAASLKEESILVINMRPGYVKTDMSKGNGEITTQESISTMLNTLSRLDDSHHGSYIDRHGERIPF